MKIKILLEEILNLPKIKKFSLPGVCLEIEVIKGPTNAKNKISSNAKAIWQRDAQIRIVVLRFPRIHLAVEKNEKIESIFGVLALR
jgi:methyl coenzyme M reductase subunit D